MDKYITPVKKILPYILNTLHWPEQLGGLRFTET